MLWLPARDSLRRACLVLLIMISLAASGCGDLGGPGGKASEKDNQGRWIESAEFASWSQFKVGTYITVQTIVKAEKAGNTQTKKTTLIELTPDKAVLRVEHTMRYDDDVLYEYRKILDARSYAELVRSAVVPETTTKTIRRREFVPGDEIEYTLDAQYMENEWKRLSASGTQIVKTPAGSFTCGCEEKAAYKMCLSPEVPRWIVLCESTDPMAAVTIRLVEFHAP